MEKISWTGKLGILHTGLASGPPEALPIVAIHGMTSGPASFAHILRNLSDEFRIVSWAVPGYAGAHKVTGSAELSSYAERLIEFIEGVVKRPVVLLGHSLGTLIAAKAAAQRSDLVAGLVLTNPVAGLGQEREKTKMERVGLRVQALAEQGVSQFCVQRVPGMFGPGTPAPVVAAAIEVGRDALSIDGFTAAGELLCNSSMVDALSQYHGPLRLMTGQLDTVSTMDLLYALANGRKEVQPEVFIGCGHSVHLEQPEEFELRLRTFARCVT
jgi:pimeloyl-ACP methyl ester carboxylesterase